MPIYTTYASAARELADACHESHPDPIHRTVRFRECPQQTARAKSTALSGGKWQRVAPARAVLERPSLLLLDESTSALDAPSERRIFTSLAHYFSNQTILFISHRISALKWVDRIVVLNQGVVEDQGTHEQLIVRSGLYSWLHSAVTPTAPAPANYSSTQ